MTIVYLDTSVALAHLLSEDRHPPDSLWSQHLVSSRLLEYEAWRRIHESGLAATHGEALRLLLSRLGFLELDTSVLARALDPFPAGVRTLDALHLASIEFLRGRNQRVELASYDRRLLRAARKLRIPVLALP